MGEFLRILTCAAGEIFFFYGGVLQKSKDFRQILKGFAKIGKIYGGLWNFPLNFTGEFLWIFDPRRRRKFFFYGGLFMDFGPVVLKNFMGGGGEIKKTLA